jgi:hypothetical protein
VISATVRSTRCHGWPAGHPHPSRVPRARKGGRAERILDEARAAGCVIAKKVNGVHVLDRGAFDPEAEEYQIVAPIAGG